MERKALYLFTSVLCGVGVYLHSPAVVVSAVVLWGLSVAETVLNQKKRDADISTLLHRMDLLEKDHKSLSMDISNVAERAKTVLGEVY